MTVCCKNCRWSQDDFWDETYNPFKCAAGDQAEFLTVLARPPEERVQRMDVGWVRDTGMKGVRTPEGWYEVSQKDVLVWRFEQLLRRVKGMGWWTYADFKNDPHPTCPTCGSTSLSVD